LYCALIVSANEKSIAIISEMLYQASVRSIINVKTAGEARRQLIDNDYDICIIDTPLPDGQGAEIACNIAEKCMGGTLLIVHASQLEEVSDMVENYGVLTLSKPILRDVLWSAIKMTLASAKRMSVMRQENQKLIAKIEDIRIIDRAKCLLISYLSLSEPEAHKHIEKLAMDMRMTRRAVAEEILKTYES
jgi:AmiR/NasT family two-component response regulator